jgi:predicted O-methyltransferase YrrM
MPVYDALYHAYRQRGFDIATGLNPTLMKDFYQAAFTWLVQDGASVTDGLGISLEEMYFLESLARVRPARSIFVIGNSFGWSTLTLGLANPGSRVLAIDSGDDLNSLEGISLTNLLAKDLAIDTTAMEGTSPEDVPSVISQFFDAPIDLAFIDGFHSNEQIVKDWRALRPFLAPDAVVLFHDVVYLDLISGYEQVVAESLGQGSLLHATTTGMGLLVREPDAPLSRVIAAFAGTANARAVVRAEAEAHADRRGYEQRTDALALLRATTGPKG